MCFVLGNGYTIPSEQVICPTFLSIPTSQTGLSDSSIIDFINNVGVPITTFFFNRARLGNGIGIGVVAGHVKLAYLLYM